VFDAGQDPLDLVAAVLRHGELQRRRSQKRMQRLHPLARTIGIAEDFYGMGPERIVIGERRWPRAPSWD
jgi:hypothetical protein